jgi:segregation and condensation protein B
MDLSHQIEGVLFYKASPMKKLALCKLFSVDDATIAAALEALHTRLQNGAVVLSQSDSEVQLVTSSALDALIESVRKDEMKRDIGKAGAETLAIILYKGPIGRAEIDRIRGVNSSFILRNLLVRGLIEREVEKNASLFSITSHLLSHLGITNKRELPNYAGVLDQLEKFEADQLEQETTNNV